MGKSLPAITVFGLSIEYLAQDMMKTGDNNVGGGITMDDVHWVLTVPAIWSDAAKQFMREAAVKGGIKTEKLSIAKEPEAASIFCRHLPVEKSGGEATISSLPPGSKYMILDAGGGTIDVTVHQVTESGGLKEICAASGGGWGGILVDNAFKELLVKLFSEHIYTIFVESMTEDWLDLWRTFDSKKKTVDPASSVTVNMKLPTSLLKLYKQKTRVDFEDMLEHSTYASKITIRGGDKVRFDSTLMKDLFHASINKTVSHVKSILEENAHDIGAILMVGGFSESPMLQHAVKKEFRQVKVIIPREASSSILRGAVAFGHNPKSITQRVLPNTYGIRTCVSFKKGTHPEYLKENRNGRELCIKTFSKHVEIGQSVNVGEPQIEKYYWPASENQNLVTVPIYASKLNNPKYTDQGCDKIGEFTVDISNLPADLQREDRKVFVSLTFSGTEITASARLDKTGEITAASFDFLE